MTYYSKLSILIHEIENHFMKKFVRTCFIISDLLNMLNIPYLIIFGKVIINNKLKLNKLQIDGAKLKIISYYHLGGFKYAILIIFNKNFKQLIKYYSTLTEKHKFHNFIIELNKLGDR